MRRAFATARQLVLYEAREIWHRGFITFDTETTGLEPEDQIVQWAVCSQEGEVLGSGFVKPTVPISDGAFAIHGIDNVQLGEAPSFAEAWPTIRELLAGRVVVMYNATFDLGKLWSSAHAHGIEIPYDLIKDVCAMHLFARFYGQYHEYWGTYTWQKLEVAMSHLQIQVAGQAHHAEHDAAATALLIKRLAELAELELPPGWHPPVLVQCAGCRQVVRECAEVDEIWYCQPCGLANGTFHRCPKCTHIVETPATGSPQDDLCLFCQQQAHQDAMLLSGVWHRCPDFPQHIVQTPDPLEPCEHCQRQRVWKQQWEETNRRRQELIEQERKERRRASAKAYRERRKARELENRQRAALGLPPLETHQAKVAEDEIIQHRGHHFQRRKDRQGRIEVYCVRCEAVWCQYPSRFCAGIKTYRSWQSIPEHLKTRTQLLKLHLQPGEGQQAVAVMDGAFGRYVLYEQEGCIPHISKARSKP